MKLLFDQNISHKILNHLPELFSESTTIKNEGLINVPDREIWEFAKENGYSIVTQDSDFSHLTSLFGFPPKVIWIRAGNVSTKQITNIIMDHLEKTKNFIADHKHGCLEIIYTGK